LPYLVTGTIAIILCLIWIAAAPTFALLLIGVGFWQLSSNLVHGPWQAILPDAVPFHQRGLASGLKLFCEGLAAVIGRLIAGQLLGLVPTWGSVAIGAAIAVPVLCLILGIIITARGIHLAPSNELTVPRRSIREALYFSFSVALRT